MTPSKKALFEDNQDQNSALPSAFTLTNGDSVLT
jgi:hypothetical protein